MSTPSIEIVTANGRQIEPWLDSLAELRIRVFRDFPYLYDGSLEYETRYLQTYLDTESSIAVIALCNGQPIGASTGAALIDEEADFKRPFITAGIPPEKVFYCAESVLLPEYRGNGLYRTFFQQREQWARSLHGIKISAFCAVQRPPDHPLKPADYRDLDDVWRHFGYRPHPDLSTSFNWKDIDHPSETPKPMQYYLKTLFNPEP